MHGRDGWAQYAQVMRILATLAVAMLTVTACGSSAPASSSADNVRVCQHYRTQRAYVKNLATPTLSDAIKWEGWVAVDSGQATPGTQVASDLKEMYADMQGTRSLYAISGRVLDDCKALGVTFQP